MVLAHRRLCAGSAIARGPPRSRAVRSTAVPAALRFVMRFSRRFSAHRKLAAGLRGAARTGAPHAAATALTRSFSRPFRFRRRRRHTRRLHAFPRRPSENRAHRPRHARQACDAYRARSAPSLWRVVAWVASRKRRHARDRRPAWGSAHSRAMSKSRHDHGRRLHRQPRRDHSAGFWPIPLARSGAGSDRPNCVIGGDRKFWKMVGEVPVCGRMVRRVRRSVITRKR